MGEQKTKEGWRVQSGLLERTLENQERKFAELVNSETCSSVLRTNRTSKPPLIVSF